jgi:hypothetical protein
MLLSDRPSYVSHLHRSLTLRGRWISSLFEVPKLHARIWYRFTVLPRKLLEALFRTFKKWMLVSEFRQIWSDCHRSARVGLVSIGTWLRAGQSDVRVSEGSETGSGPHPNSCSVGNGLLPGSSDQAVMLATHFLLAQRIRMMELYLHARYMP